jgi:outer membrane protein assembly factor BamA
MMGPNFRVVVPGVYPASKLATDEEAGGGVAHVEGVRPLGIGSFALGVVFDSRDDEIFPRCGQFHQAGLRYAQGFPLGSGIRYEQASAIFAWFVPVGRDSVLALRGVLDFKTGQVPFYDLFTAGPFITSPMPGGAEGVRGVPVGRYLGPIKGVANAELRSLAAPLRVFGGSFRLGGAVFGDTGRVWSDYSFSSPLDGKGVGLKYGVGLGSYLLWGQAAIFRLDLAYSPDARADNPRFPLGIYVEDGTMF